MKTIDHAVREHRKPSRIFRDNGMEFISKDIDLWAYVDGVELDFSSPGKPTDNVFVEPSTAGFGKSA